MALSWHGRTGAYSLYIDGMAVGVGALGMGASSPRGGRFILGQRVDASTGGHVPGFALQGSVSNANLFDQVLTPAQVALTMGFVGPEFTRSVIRRWSDFRLGMEGPSLTEVVPSAALQAPLAKPDPRGSNDYDAHFVVGEADGQAAGGAMAVVGFTEMPAFSICVWLRHRNDARQTFGAVAASYAVAGEMDTFALRSNFDFVLHGHLHLLQKVPKSGNWHHWCLTHGASGDWRAYVDAREEASGSNTRGGLPGGGALVLGQLQRKLGASYTSGTAYDGAMTDLGVWRQALSPDGVRRAREGVDHGDVKAWRALINKTSGNVRLVSPSSLERGRTPTRTDS